MDAGVGGVKSPDNVYDWPPYPFVLLNSHNFFFISVVDGAASESVDHITQFSIRNWP